MPGDTNDTQDVFVRNRQTGTTRRVSLGPGGAQGDSSSSKSALSADGRFVAFTSNARNLVPGDTNDTQDVFVRNRQTGMTRRVSLGPGGGQGNGSSGGSALSADGRFVAFQSDASNLVPGDTNGAADVFVRDRQTGTTRRVSLGPGGAQAGGDNCCSPVALSADGRFIAFESKAANLVPGDTNLAADVFVRDRQTGMTRRVSPGPGGGQGDGSSAQPALSADGRFVAFYSEAANLVPGDTNGAADVFVRDRQIGTTRRVSLGPGGAQGDGGSFRRRSRRMGASSPSSRMPPTWCRAIPTARPTCSSASSRLEAVTILVPSGPNPADQTLSSWPRRTRGSPLPSAIHTRAVLSSEAVTIRVPSGLNPADQTPPSWPRRTRGSPLPSAIHTRAVLSSEPVTILVPSGLNSAE